MSTKFSIRSTWKRISYILPKTRKANVHSPHFSVWEITLELVRSNAGSTTAFRVTRPMAGNWPSFKMRANLPIAGTVLFAPFQSQGKDLSIGRWMIQMDEFATYDTKSSEYGKINLRHPKKSPDESKQTSLSRPNVNPSIHLGTDRLYWTMEWK